VAEGIGLIRETSLEYTEDWITQAISVPSVEAFAIIVEDKHAGNVVLEKIDPKRLQARLHIYIGDPDRRGHGVGGAALGLVLERAFGTLGLKRVWLTVHAENEPAIAIYEAAGFEREAVLADQFVVAGGRTDGLLMAITAERFGRP
jgi:RimJ/RimL family protein N-acetyltransferase